MKYVSYVFEGDQEYGVLDNTIILRLKKALADEEGGAPDDLLSLIRSGEDVVRKAVDSTETIRSNPDYHVALEQVKLLAPIRKPEKIICIGNNYQDHCREAGVEPPKNPILFPKYPNAIQNPGDPELVSAEHGVREARGQTKNAHRRESRFPWSWRRLDCCVLWNLAFRKGSPGSAYPFASRNQADAAPRAARDSGGRIRC